MTTPIQTLRAKKQEITDQYNRVLATKYRNDGRTSFEVENAKFEEGKQKDLERINKQLEQYREAIDSLMAIRQGTF